MAKKKLGVKKFVVESTADKVEIDGKQKVLRDNAVILGMKIHGNGKMTVTADLDRKHKKPTKKELKAFGTGKGKKSGKGKK